MEAVKTKSKTPQIRKSKKKKESDENKNKESNHSENGTEITASAEVENFQEDSFSHNDSIEIENLNLLSDCSTITVNKNSVNVESKKDVENSDSNPEKYYSLLDDSKSIEDSSLPEDKVYIKDNNTSLHELPEENNQNKCDNDISVGYDVAADYASSTEEATVLNSRMDELIDSDSNSDCIPNSMATDLKFGIPKEQLSAPYSIVQNCNYDSIQSTEDTCYPELLSRIKCTINEASRKKLQPFSETELSNLYYNAELQNHNFFINNFIEIELKSGIIVGHYLYKLLTEYLKCRDNVNKNKANFESLLEDCKQLKEKIWILSTSSLTEYGECQDGNPVSATHNFTVAHFNNYIYENFSRCVHELEIQATESYISNIFNEILYHSKIQHYIDSTCNAFSHLSSKIPVQLYNESEPRSPYGIDQRSLINDLKNAISVLFAFQRRPIKDEYFINESRQWLVKLVSVLLRISTTNDHLFLLHHILRCPAGVSKWASCFIQPPASYRDTTNQFYVDHLITTLAAILLPIDGRDLFLQPIEAGQEDNSMWVFIDSDGEDCDDDTGSKTALKENDLISFLNQVPLADLFRQVNLINRRNEEDTYDVNNVTDRDILRSVAIGTLLVNLFEKGIVNYQNVVYKQFCKLLGRLIQHTACYITEHWQMFWEAYVQRSVVDGEMLNRLQTEYDEFLVRIVNTLYTTPNRIGWQYLATLPFGMISTYTLWRLYQYLFHLNSESDLLMNEQFVETLGQLPDNDIYYFLTTLTNMALCRKDSDSLFIQSIILQLFKIGFVNNVLRDKCMKPSRILIAGLIGKHPNLISNILSTLRRDFELVGRFGLYLFKELPVSLWKPNLADLQIIRVWLLSSSLTSWENTLARYILTNLNWSTELTETELFLPRDFHCHVAIIIVNAIYTHAEEIVPLGSSAIISERVKQMSSMVRNPSPEITFNNWAWQMLLKLKLHLLDQPMCIARMSLTDHRIAAQIPDINANIEDMRILSDGINRNQSVAFYVTMLMSNVGHSIPLICEFCWDYCNTLISMYRYSHVLHVLQLILPYFLDSIDSLVKEESFIKLISKLLVADSTYMKMVKNLIITDFPGTILKQFCSLIQYHVDNYSRFCLSNPYLFVEMWMRTLSLVWNDGCRSVAYLMDKLFSSAFCDDILKQIIINNLSYLIRDISSTDQSAASGGLTSLVSWIGYGSRMDLTSIPVSLLPRNYTVVTESPYFAYFALYMEEMFTQKQNQLWSEVLKNLATTSGKANVDMAVKKACMTLKLNSIPASWLAIYRWSMYALQLPCHHPILPLFWQNFFRLYLYRIPSRNDGIVCVGSKFFEGTINSNYLKKIKKKIQDCVIHFTNKSFANDYEKLHCTNLVSLYKSFILWLEKPALQEPDLFFPGLSAAYNVTKLSEVIAGDETMWIVYIDFDQIKTEQNELRETWSKTLCRDVNIAIDRVVCFPEDINNMVNMMDRLKSYDKRIPPPELSIVPSAVPTIPREMFLNKSQMLDFLDEYFEILTQFTKNYKFRKTELNSAAKSLMNAYRFLYNETQIEIKLYAACDTVSPFYKRKTVSSIHCAGPALISMRISEARLNKSLNHTAEKSEIDFQMFLKQNLTQPSMQLCIACIVIESTVATISKEVTETRQAADHNLLGLLHDVAVALFYKLVSMCNSKLSSYFPIKILLKKTIDELGIACIDNIETECPKLLKVILKNPTIHKLLVPHLTPSVVSAATFVRLYSKVTPKISTKNVEFILHVMSRFKIRNWLNEKSPKASDRTDLINAIVNSLKDMNNQPDKVVLPLHKILREDLCQILMYNFPEHYSEIIYILLRYSAEEKLSCDVWYDVMNTLLFCTSNSTKKNADVSSILRSDLSVIQIRDIARKHAFELTNLSLQKLIENSSMMGGNFLKERLQYGLYGLYPKYRVYMEPLIAYHSIVGHAIVASVFCVHQTALADQICETIWPVLLNLYAPWMVPYFTGNLHEPPEAWIQQLTDDRSILLPWTYIESDMTLAHKMISTFIDCLKFTIDALPATSVVLSNVLQWYITQFAHTTVKEHILSVIQSNLITLSWNRYSPTLSDMELMLKVVDQYLPMCHSFVGSIFVDIPWETVITNDQPQNITRTHIILLNLLIKLANEPNLRQTSAKVSSLLQTAQMFHWYLVDATNYEYVLNWFVMSYDPRVLLLVSDEDCNGIDIAAFELLRIAAGFTEKSTNHHSTTSRKRQMFVKACAKLSLLLANRYKPVFAGHQRQMELALIRILDQIESVITATAAAENRILESTKLMSELLMLLNQPNCNILPKTMMQVLLNWLSHRSPSSCVLEGLIKVIFSTVTDVANIGVILEACLIAWFKNPEDCDWNKIFEIFQNTRQACFSNGLITNNHLLSLYALTVKHLEYDQNVFIHKQIIQWITNLKPNSDNENKLPLLWSLAFKCCDCNQAEIMTSLLELCTYFQQITNMKSGWALFSVMGINKHHIPTLRCKLLGHVLNAFITIKLSEQNSETLDAESIESNDSEKRNMISMGTEYMKAHSVIENLMSDKHYSEYRITLETALRLLKSKNVTINDGERFTITLAKQLYTEEFIHVIRIEEF